MTQVPACLHGLIDFNMDICLELANIDEVGEGKLRMIEKMVEGHGEVQVFGQLLVKPLVPVWRRTVHTRQCIEAHFDVGRKCQRGQCHTVFIQRIPIAVAAERVGHRKTHNGIISEFTSLRKQREIGGLDVVEFVYESYKIKGDKSGK